VISGKGRPDAAPHEQGQAVTLAPSAPIAGRKVTATGTERRALSRSAPPASWGALERRSLCRPSAPDGEGQARGQARQAHGEPPSIIDRRLRFEQMRNER
jgi:hypothetical protein